MVKIPSAHSPSGASRTLAAADREAPALTERSSLQSKAEFAEFGWRVSTVSSKSHRFAENRSIHAASIIANGNIRSFAKKLEVNPDNACPGGDAVIDQISDGGREIVANLSKGVNQTLC
jgi:hypothetical protein